MDGWIGGVRQTDRKTGIESGCRCHSEGCVEGVDPSIRGFLRVWSELVGGGAGRDKQSV